MDEAQRLRWAYRLGVVERWNVVPTIQKQTVAGHSYNVAMLADHMLMCAFDGDAPESLRLEVLLEALRHDVAEAKYGDTPAPAKRTKSNAELTGVEALVKVADNLDAYLFLKFEARMGNSLALELAGSIVMNIKRLMAHPRSLLGSFFSDAPELLQFYWMIMRASHPSMETQTGDEAEEAPNEEPESVLDDAGNVVPF